MSSPTTRTAASRGHRRRLWPLAALLALAALWPAGAAAESRTFVNFDELFPTIGSVGGPAFVFPSTISVGGVPGTVTSVRVSTPSLDSSSPDDLDMALSGPNGQTVMLMSDACGVNPNTIEDEYYTFDDAAPTFLSNSGPCPPHQRASYLPTNYLGGAPEPDDLSAVGGPSGPFGNKLAALAGGSANGDWNLWLFDDDELAFSGFGLRSWVLHLEVTPPPPPPPTIVTVQVPAAATKPTGKRARALAKCKSKPTQEAKKRCRNNARKLPA